MASLPRAVVDDARREIGDQQVLPATSGSRAAMSLARASVRTAIEWLNVHSGIDRRDAYALSAMAVSFRVTQVGQPDRLGLFLGPTAHKCAPSSPKLVLGDRVADRTAASMDPSP